MQNRLFSDSEELSSIQSGKSFWKRIKNAASSIFMVFRYKFQLFRQVGERSAATPCSDANTTTLYFYPLAVGVPKSWTNGYTYYDSTSVTRA